MQASTDLLTARQRAAAARRIVIKLGTNVIIRDDGAPAVGLIHGLVESAINLRREGREVIFVSSGAIALGVRRLGMDASPTGLQTTFAQKCMP